MFCYLALPLHSVLLLCNYYEFDILLNLSSVISRDIGINSDLNKPLDGLL